MLFDPSKSCRILASNNSTCFTCRFRASSIQVNPYMTKKVKYYFIFLDIVSFRFFTDKSTRLGPNKRNYTALSSTLWPPEVLCFGHVTSWSGGGERVGPRNNGNQLATVVEFWEKQNGGQKCALVVVNCTLRFRLKISF